MINIRRSDERGGGNYGWLDTKYTFSFNTYYDPNFMGFRSLRVINEDYVAENQGFGTHGHANMEIITYVIEGALAHKDSTGGEEVLRPHEVQRMTAGTGIRHSEFNPSKTEKVHLYQIWILPEKDGLAPGYEQTYFAPKTKKVSRPDLFAPNRRLRRARLRVLICLVWFPAQNKSARNPALIRLFPAESRFDKDELSRFPTD